MKPQDFVKEINRMCKSNGPFCARCRIVDGPCSFFMNGIKPEQFAEMYDAVSEWSDSHPVKTRQSEFLKQFPNADLTRLQPCTLEKNKRTMWCGKYADFEANGCCEECRNDYWNEEVGN